MMGFTIGGRGLGRFGRVLVLEPGPPLIVGIVVETV
jgi:hypothetical protein